MSARGRIVEQFEMSQMAKNGVSNYRKIELPKEVIIRTESVEGVPKTTKQPKIREGVPPEPEEWIGKNGREITKRWEKVAIDKVESSNRNIVELHTSVPIIYYVMMGFGLVTAGFGLASAIFGAANLPVYRSVMIGGIGVFLVAFIGFLEIKRTERRLKITG